MTGFYDLARGDSAVVALQQERGKFKNPTCFGNKVPNAREKIKDVFQYQPAVH